MNELATNYLMTGRSRPRGSALPRGSAHRARTLSPTTYRRRARWKGCRYDLVRRRLGQEALPLAEEALRIAIQSTGENSLDVALAYSSVAESHRIMQAGGAGAAFVPQSARLVREGARARPSQGGISAEPGGTDPDARRQARAGGSSHDAGGEVAEEDVSGLRGGTGDRAEQSRAAALAAETLPRCRRGVFRRRRTPREVQRKHRDRSWPTSLQNLAVGSRERAPASTTRPA